MDLLNLSGRLNVYPSADTTADRTAVVSGLEFNVRSTLSRYSVQKLHLTDDTVQTLAVGSGASILFAQIDQGDGVLFQITTAHASAQEVPVNSTFVLDNTRTSDLITGLTVKRVGSLDVVANLVVGG